MLLYVHSSNIHDFRINYISEGNIFATTCMTTIQIIHWIPIENSIAIDKAVN